MPVLKPPRIGRGARLMTDEERWAAVVRRDRSADGLFYYSVRTTGVYCRPSCAARLPRRENVQFHTTRETAEAEGFRACRRCRPAISVPIGHADIVARACRQIENADEPLSLDALAGAAGLSRFHFHRVLKATTGVTPRAYAAAHRARRVRKELAPCITRCSFTRRRGTRWRRDVVAPS